MKIKALVPWSNGEISMEQYEVREVTDSLGNELISAGVAVEIGGGGLPPVTESDAGKVLSVNDSGVWGAQMLLPELAVTDNGKVLTAKVKKSIVVAPLQSIEIEDDNIASLVGFVTQSFVSADYVIVTVDGREFIATVQERIYEDVTEHYASIGYKNIVVHSTSGSSYVSGDVGTYDISVYVANMVELQAENVLPETNVYRRGAVLSIRDGVWTATGVPRVNNFDGYQIIPITYDGSDFATTITPNDIDLGYQVNGGEYYPPFIYSSFTRADLMGSSIPLLAIIGNADGVEFQTPIVPLDALGLTGMVGTLMLSISGDADDPYTVTLIKWSAT